MQQLNVIGKRWFHVFEKDGSFTWIETTEEDYLSGKKSPIRSNTDNGAWKFSCGKYKYDQAEVTPTGDIQEGFYAIDPGDETSILCKPTDGKEVILESKHIVDGELTSEGVIKYDYEVAKNYR